MEESARAGSGIIASGDVQGWPLICQGWFSDDAINLIMLNGEGLHNLVKDPLVPTWAKFKGDVSGM